jgi:excisionase family DNA binding protein
MGPPSKPYFTTAEIAEICDVSIVCVGNWIRAGTLRAYRPPQGHYRVSPEDLLAFLHGSGMPTPPEVRDQSVLRVVVVDDEPMVRAVVANILEAAGDMEVITAADGFEAGKVVTDRQPDVVILDLRMPGLDGATVCQRIKNDPRTAHSRVLFLTGYTDPDNLNLIRSSGADGYIAKPFVAKSLIDAVRGLAGQAARRVRAPEPVSPAPDR